MTRRQRLSRSKPPSRPLVKQRIERFETQAYGDIVNHKPNLARAIPQGNP
jgi:hypothetical protein